MEKTDEPKIELFVKAGSNGECIGTCHLCQRIFMILWLKKVTFDVTTVDQTRKTMEMKRLAPGAQPPFLKFNGSVITDFMEIEDFLEQTFCPPRYPNLRPKNQESFNAGADIFQKFSAYIKNNIPGRHEVLETHLLKALLHLEDYLQRPLPTESGPNSRRRFLDGDELTLADCDLLPKLNIVLVVSQSARDFSIPDNFPNVARYMSEAKKMVEFSRSSPADSELIASYSFQRLSM
uniref:chloride intracellular channel protein 2-like isoform X1 n=2 Tax=Myxine glutinosa TaxID=7769 RepID=UPI00358F7310